MLVIGHRGARGLAPENTAASFDAAISYGVDAIELDVRLSGDNVPIIIHDPKINGLAVLRTPLKKLQDALPGLLTLEEGLKHIPTTMPLRIEIKPIDSVTEIAQCIRMHRANNPDRASVEISSYSPHVLRNIKQELPNIPLILNEKWSGVRASWRAKRLGITGVCMNQRWLWSGFIRNFSKRYRLSTYTLNDPAKARKWAKAGLYAVITDYPDRFAKD